jgi:uncharacterized protein YqeY
MALRERLEADLKAAMLARDEVARDTLRMVLSDVKKKEIDEGEIGEEGVLAVLAKASKTRQESIDQFQSAGRVDLATKERAELEVLKRYLPTALSEQETRELVQRLLKELGIQGKQDIGRLMKAVMAQYKGKVDGKLVQRIASELVS